MVIILYYALQTTVLTHHTLTHEKSKCRELQSQSICIKIKIGDYKYV